MDNTPSRLGEMILVRLAAAGNPPSQSALERCLKPYFSCRLGLSDGQWRTLLENTLDELAHQGFVERKPTSLTEIGKAVACHFLQVEDLPADCKWMTLRNRYLLARALEIRPREAKEWKRLATADGLRAAVLVRFYGLSLDPLPTLTQALEALAQQQAQQAGEIEASGTKTEVREEILRETLIPDQPGDLKTRLPALVTKARNNSIESLRQAVINHWLDECDAKSCQLVCSSQSKKIPPPASESPVTPADLSEFARQIQELARHSQTGRFGDNKVFLSHLWKHFQKESPRTGITRQEFDDRLLEANRQNLIILSRADLISEMDPADVEASEIALPHATFHFIRTDVPSE